MELKRFLKNGAILAEDVGNNTNGNSIAGSPIMIDTPFGKGLKFNGENNYINLGNNPNLNVTDAITIGAWISPHNISGIRNQFLIWKMILPV